jgi:hypothetical protein
MTPSVLRLWGATWTGHLALAISCVLRWFRMPYAPWYSYVDVVDFVPIVAMLTLALLSRSRLKIIALIMWTILSLFAVYGAWATFPLWGKGILDAPLPVQARFQSISTAADTLQNFAAIVLAATGFGFLVYELRNRPTQTSRDAKR